MRNRALAGHEFAPAGSAAGIGPNLDDLAAAAERAGVPLEEFVRTSITNPGDYIEPNFPNAMPNAYGGLSGEQLDALVQYLVEGNA